MEKQPALGGIYMNMKILYGIQLTGNGHLTRSVQIIRELKSRGHEVDIVTSGSNSQLDIPYEVKAKKEGLSFFYDRSGGIDWFKTIKKLNLGRFLSEIEFDASGYDLVISDFEPVSAWSAKRHGVKSIGIGNQYSLLSKNAPRPTSPNKISEQFIKRFAKCDEAIALGYERHDSFVYLPVIDESIYSAKVSDEGFYLVYLPSISNERLSFAFEKSGVRYRIYSPESKEETDSIKKPNSEGFKKDLLSCSGVITASGFSTTTEALVLGKKLWSIPIRGQYEQICNAIALRKMGIFTKEFCEESLIEWIREYNPIDYEWGDPIAEIADKIEEIWKR
jgi:uncharacterized protein (TIGR00661 family)